MTILRHSLSFGCIRWMVAVIMAILCGSPLENVNYVFEHCDQLYLTGMTSRQQTTYVCAPCSCLSPTIHSG